MEEIKEFAVSIGLIVLGEAESKIKGTKGNQEFGLYFSRRAC